MMTRRDYIAVSDILSEYAPLVEQHDLFDQMVNDFADYMSDDNDRFLRSKFIDACYSKIVMAS
jgi:hypothetical protein